MVDSMLNVIREVGETIDGEEQGNTIKAIVGMQRPWAWGPS